MYHTYSTDAIVLESKAMGDSSRLLWLFTKDFGLILADVKSARGHLSKLRPSIQTYSYGLFTLVRGKRGWKVINVIGKGNHYYELRSTRSDAIEALARTSHVMRKLIGLDDVVHEDVFSLLSQGIEQMKCSNATESCVIESVMVCRMLGRLGYMTHEGLPQLLVSPYLNFSEELLAAAVPMRAALNRRINASLKQTGLL
ncbi:MAG: hypothetical protein COV34_00520 [Candidatus Zambryskibacteria bacterium CG10_big_fil_rev_8_21_14_0_10_42_12]|uniref:DNA replication/recombination mediator RecO N-terminal domain-containing protein n=1 Tax=Candidatus Zambryskibacteria bacterium CG10_big_fil_rev_8_21_14_0_10_42_12 TaxID=1975115 RepID=A0A2H0QX00_9BACT|nr:MAG: hypothetical protein COV34_00520 [Candidatus Zambryskibacteria bacterium CG10_big_fil_rev_8_21_14_0_10_42_12]